MNTADSNKAFAQIVHQPGSVFQINEKEGRKGWVGCFVMATEIKPWGIQGFVSIPHTHEEQQNAHIRLTWDEIDYIGRATLVPENLSETPNPG